MAGCVALRIFYTTVGMWFSKVGIILLIRSPTFVAGPMAYPV